MTRLNLIIFGLLVAVTSLTIWYQSQLDEDAIIGIGVIALLAPSLVILVARVWRRYPVYVSVTVWIGAYICVRLLLLAIAPNTGRDTTLALVEIGLLAALIGLTLALARYLAVPTSDTGEAERREPEEGRPTMAEIRRCLMQCRRQGRPLSAIVVDLCASTSNAGPADRPVTMSRKHGSRVPVPRLRREAVERIIYSSLRRTDLMFRKDGADLVVILCPNLDRHSTIITIERIQCEVAHRLRHMIKVGSASFPADALTLDDLIHKAKLDMARRENARHGSTEPAGTESAEPLAPNAAHAD